MSIKTIFLAAAVATVTAGTSMAAPLTEKYDVTSAVGSGSNHSMWISGGLGGGIGSDFDFSPAGMLSLFADGTATLMGRLQSQNDSNSGFNISFNYDNSFDRKPAFKSENGSKQIASTFFRDLEGGTLKGFGVLAGLNLSVSRLPVNGKYAVQIGGSNGVNNGANNKNKNFGMAHWFKIVVDKAECKICRSNKIKKLNGRQGDINVDLEGGPVGGQVPLPASGLLLIGGLAGLAGLRRKRRS